MATVERPEERDKNFTSRRPGRPRKIGRVPKRRVIGVSVDRDLYLDLGEIAAGMDRPITFVCRQMIQDAVAAMLAEGQR